MEEKLVERSKLWKLIVIRDLILSTANGVFVAYIFFLLIKLYAVD